MAVPGLQERNLCPDAVEPHGSVEPAALEPAPSPPPESRFDEELVCGRQVVR